MAVPEQAPAGPAVLRHRAARSQRSSSALPRLARTFLTALACCFPKPRRGRLPPATAAGERRHRQRRRCPGRAAQLRRPRRGVSSAGRVPQADGCRARPRGARRVLVPAPLRACAPRRAVAVSLGRAVGVAAPLGTAEGERGAGAARPQRPAERRGRAGGPGDGGPGAGGPQQRPRSSSRGSLGAPLRG